MKNVVIVGGGVAGLSCGVYAQLNNFNCTIVEKRLAVGGASTSWMREGCLVDGSIRMLLGTGENQLFQLWKTLGAIRKEDIASPKNMLNYYSADGSEVKLSRNFIELSRCLLSLGDCYETSELLRCIEIMQGAFVSVEKPVDMMGISELAAYTTKNRNIKKLVKKYDGITIDKFFCGKNDKINKLLSDCFGGGLLICDLAFILAQFTLGNADFPKISAIELSNNIAEEYTRLGGKIIINAEVANIIVDGNKAIGVCLADGKIINADYIVIATCAPKVRLQLLGGNTNSCFDKTVNNDDIVTPCIFSYCTNDSVYKLPQYSVFECEEFEIAGKLKTSCMLRKFDYIKNPSGKVTLISVVAQDGQDAKFWQDLRAKSQSEYDIVKAKCAERIKAILVAKYPELSGNIETLDVATPSTYLRYLDMSYICNPSLVHLICQKPTRQKIKIKNLFLTDEHSSDNLAYAAISGRHTSVRIARAARTQFRSR